MLYYDILCISISINYRPRLCFCNLLSDVHPPLLCRLCQAIRQSTRFGSRMWRIAIHMMNLSARRISWFVGNFLTFDPCRKGTSKTYRYLRTYIHNMNPLNRPSKWNGTPSPKSSQQTSKVTDSPSAATQGAQTAWNCSCGINFCVSPEKRLQVPCQVLESGGLRISDGLKHLRWVFVWVFLAVSMRYRIGQKKGDDWDYRWLCLWWYIRYIIEIRKVKKKWRPKCSKKKTTENSHSPTLHAPFFPLWRFQPCHPHKSI